MRRVVVRAASSLGLGLVLGCTGPSPTTTATPLASRSMVPAVSPSATASGSPPPSFPAPAATTWQVSAVAPMLRSRDGFRALVLGDDTVLVVGDDEACHPGGAPPGSETSERYDPVANAWSHAASLNNPRKDFAMVPAADGGVMVIGGLNAADQPFSSTKRFDLDRAEWVDGPLLNRAHGDPSAVTSREGRVHVVGPTIPDETSTTSTVEVLASDGSRWDDGGRIEGVTVRAVVGLSDGRLAALGSVFEGPDTVYILDPGAQGWRPMASPGFDFVERIAPVGGGGLLAFGSNYDPATGGTEPASPQRHDPAADRWIETGPMIEPRTDPMVTSLPDGRLLVAGGVVGPRDVFDGQIVRSSEIYDPRTDTWSAGPELLEIRYDGQAITLNDASVLILGGLNVRNVGGDTPFCAERLTSVERLTPAP